MTIEQTLLRQRRVLAEFGELALASDDMDLIFNEACRLVGDALGTQMAKFMVLQDDGMTLFLRDGVGWKPGTVGRVRVRADAGSPERFSLDTGNPVISTDRATESRFRYHDFQIDNGVQAFVNVLVHGASEELPFGIFEVDSRTPRAFTEDDIDFLRGYANLLGAVLRRSMTHSAMRLTEHKLRESERHYRIAAELNPLWPWTADDHGDLTSIDQRWFHYSGLTAEQSLGRQWIDAVHPSDQSVLTTPWTESLLTLQPFDSQIRIKSRSSEYRWFRVRALCSLDGDGNCEQWYGTIEDIDDRVHLERALRDWNDLLEDRIGQRTQQLETEQRERMTAESKLRQSQKMEAVGQLTGGIAHDFNNLLAGIIGSLELMQRRMDKGRYNDLSRYNATAMTSASRAAALTQRLLAFSRQQSLKPEVIEPRQVIANLEDIIRRSVGPSIVVECAFNANDRIKCDLNQLENAVLNLAVNARDAMPDGGRLSLKVDRHVEDGTSTAEKAMPPGAYVAISVADTGTGVSPDILSRIFDPFFTTKKIGEGTGLGLSMIYGFTQQSGGQVKVSSTLDVGTTLTMFFPIDESQQGELDVDAEVPAHNALTGHGERILVVDDEAAVRQTVSEVLAESGYHVTEAIDCVSALKQADKFDHLDVLVTDIGLPGLMNGIGLAVELRRKYPSLKVLFITGFAGGASLVSVDATTQLLTKPFQINELSEQVHSLVQANPPVLP